MKYIHCLWIHNHPEEPVVLVSEVDIKWFECRKVEIWRSGRIGWADKNGSSEGTELNLYSLLSLEDINSDPEFLAVEIAKEDFEIHWALAHSKKEKS